MQTITSYLQTNPLLTPTVGGYLIQEDKVLLGVRKKVSYGLGENLIAAIGGKLEEGETYEVALKREILEEIQVTVTSYKKVGDVIFLFPHQPKWSQKAELFIVDTWTGDPEETEAIKPLWFPKNQLPKERMWPDNLYTVPRLLAGEKINATFLYNEDGTIREYILEKK